MTSLVAQLVAPINESDSDKRQDTGLYFTLSSLNEPILMSSTFIAGETKVWQYITLMKKIYLIDCPGVVPGEGTDVEKVLKGVVRVELVQDPSVYIPAILAKVKPEYVARTYKVEPWESSKDFLEKVAQKSGKLLKGGEADIQTVSKMVVNDWQRGKLPYFTPPPGCAPPKRGHEIAVQPEEMPVESLDDSKETSEA